MALKHVYLKIEAIEDYSPVEPQQKTAPPIQYKRDGMRNPGHLDGTIPQAERDARALRAVVYREYLDPQYLVPNTAKLVPADINEPIYDHRVPGCVLWAPVGDELHIHVLNADTVPHSFHIHGIDYGIDADGAWPMGTESTDGRRSDEICPGQTWTYRFRIDKNMVGAWPFHDHSSHAAHGSVKLGLFGGLIVTERPGPAPVPTLPKGFSESLTERIGAIVGERQVRGDALPGPARQLWHDHLAFLREWHFREQLAFKPPSARGTIHIPAFFHQMLTNEAKPMFDSGDLEENGVGEFTHQFDVAGTFDYFCSFHPIMTGTVEVVSGAPATASVNILDAPAMGFYPQTVQVAPGGTVEWVNQSVQHHTVTSSSGAAMVTHTINGRGFVGNSPTIVAKAGQKLRWYVFNLDFDQNWHNFHPHDQRWEFAGENFDVRSMGPAESFIVDTQAPTVLLLPADVEKIQGPKGRPRTAKQYRLMGDFIFHCHVHHHHHLMNGMVGVVRSYRDVWLTPAMKTALENERGIQLYDPANPIPDVDPHRCKKQGPGEWEELSVDPEVTFMHACLLPNTAKVLYWGYTRPDQSRLFDPIGPTVAAPVNQPASLPGMDQNLSDLWSSEHALLDDANGTLLAHGGFAGNGGINSFRSFLFDPTTEQWSATGDTADFRFYSSTITLDDGKPVTMFGSASKSMEVYDPGSGTWSAPDGCPLSMFHHQYYPWAYLLPDGRIFIAGPHDPTHRFERDPVANVEAFSMISGDRSTGGEKGTSVLLPLRPPDHKPIVLSIGGNTPSAVNTAELIDLSAPVPAWVALPNLSVDRNEQVNSVLLPDGTVVVAGGAGGVAGGGAVELLDSTNPTAGWTAGPTMTHHRGYHSAMILLADGSVLAGGDPNSGVFERFYPGYYHNTRPTIGNAPATAAHAATITIDTPEATAISEVMLMRPGAVTHGFNMAQRAVECAISGGTASSVDVELPANPNVAPPGWYLLFVVDGFRIPSVGRWIRLT